MPYRLLGNRLTKPTNFRPRCYKAGEETSRKQTRRLTSSQIRHSDFPFSSSYCAPQATPCQHTPAARRTDISLYLYTQEGCPMLSEYAEPLSGYLGMHIICRWMSPNEGATAVVMITEEKPARLLIRGATAQRTCGSTSASQSQCFHANHTELSKGDQLVFGLHDNAIQDYGRAVVEQSLGKVTLMNSRKQRSASTRWRCVCRQS